MSPEDNPKKEEKVEDKTEEGAEKEKKIKLGVSPELKSQLKDLFVGTFGLGLIVGGAFGSLAFFLLFNVVGYYCTPDSYLLTEKTNILFFSIRLLIGIAVVMGFIFSIVYHKTSTGKYKRIILTVLAFEFIFAGAFVLAFETPHCKNYQTLISSKPLSKGEISVIDERQVTADETFDTKPIWSPDGSKLAFLRERHMVDSVDIWVINKEGGNLRQVISGSLEMEYPTWSPDGKKIAYVSWTSGNREIWVSDVLRGGQKQLTSGKRIGHISPVWSPDGRDIIYLTVGAHDQDIWIMDSNGENQRQVTSGEENDKSPFISPDGSKIIFVRDDEEGAGDIWVVNKDGTGLKQLTEGASSESLPRWSPDGSRIAFLSRPPQLSASAQIVAGEKKANVYDTLWVMNSDGSSVKQLSVDRVDEDYSWSPRGDMIAFVKLAENVANLWVVSVDGSNEKMLSLNQPFPKNPAWSPDGSRIVYYVFATGRNNLWEAILTQ